MGNAKAFGVMPSVMAAKKQWQKLYPQCAAFLAGADYSKSIPPIPGHRDGARRLQPAAAGAPEHELEDDPRPGQWRSCRRSSVAIPTVPAAVVASAGGHARSRNRQGGTGGERIVRRPLVRLRKPGIRGHQAAAGWLFLTPVIVILGAVPGRADRHGRVGQRLRLERERQPVRQQRALRRAGQLPAPAHDAGPRPEQLRHRDPQQRLLRPVRRPDPDCGRALPGRPRDAGPEGRRVLPDRVLLPVGDELGRDHRPLPLPLRSARARSTSCCRSSASRAGVVLRPARPLPRHPRRSSAWTSRRRRSRTGSSSASATGTGCPDRASPCACSS